MPLVKLLKTHVVGRPGDKVIAFGHEFTIEPDGTCVCDMHVDFIESEVRAGRIEVIDEDFDEPKQPDKTSPFEKKDDDVERQKTPLHKFGFDIDNYFGLNTEAALMKELSVLVKSDLREFAKSRIRIQFPARHTSEQMLNEISESVKLAHKAPA